MPLGGGEAILPRRAFFLGTPFCGSTVFGQALGAHSRMTYLGEVDRAVQFPASVWEEQPDPTCQYCEQRGQQCPVWTSGRVERSRRVPYGELMDFFEAELGPSTLIDGSKHPHWLRAVLAERPVDAQRTVAFLTARSPFAFCDSFRYRTGCQMWEAANVWRDVYYDGLRLINRSRLPFMVVRYEEFALDPEPVLRSACAMLGVVYEPDMVRFQEVPSHDIGGNYSVRAVAADPGGEFSSEDFRDRMHGAWAKSSGQSSVYWGKPFGGWVDDKWQKNLTADEVEQVMQTPGIADLANLLGYELSREITAWQRRKGAEA